MKNCFEFDFLAGPFMKIKNLKIIPLVVITSILKKRKMGVQYSTIHALRESAQDSLSSSAELEREIIKVREEIKIKVVEEQEMAVLHTIQLNREKDEKQIHYQQEQ